MAIIRCNGNPFETVGELPELGTGAPDLSLLAVDAVRVSLETLPGKKVLNIFPGLEPAVLGSTVHRHDVPPDQNPPFDWKVPTSLLVAVALASIRKFNLLVSGKGVSLFHISSDLPAWAGGLLARQGLSTAGKVSTFQTSFARDYGVEIKTGPLLYQCAPAVLVLDDLNKVIYAEQIREITQEPNYEAALAAVS